MLHYRVILTCQNLCKIHFKPCSHTKIKYSEKYFYTIASIKTSCKFLAGGPGAPYHSRAPSRPRGEKRCIKKGRGVGGGASSRSALFLFFTVPDVRCFITLERVFFNFPPLIVCPWHPGARVSHFFCFYRLGVRVCQPGAYVSRCCLRFPGGPVPFLPSWCVRFALSCFSVFVCRGVNLSIL